MTRQAQPTVSLASRVPTDVDARRRRLQQQIGCTVPDLLDKARRALERALNRGNDGSDDIATNPYTPTAGFRSHSCGVWLLARWGMGCGARSHTSVAPTWLTKTRGKHCEADSMNGCRNPSRSTGP